MTICVESIKAKRIPSVAFFSCKDYTRSKSEFFISSSEYPWRSRMNEYDRRNRRKDVDILAAIIHRKAHEINKIAALLRDLPSFKYVCL